MEDGWAEGSFADMPDEGAAVSNVSARTPSSPKVGEHRKRRQLFPFFLEKLTFSLPFLSIELCIGGKDRVYRNTPRVSVVNVEK